MIDKMSARLATRRAQMRAKWLLQTLVCATNKRVQERLA